MERVSISNIYGVKIIKMDYKKDILSVTIVNWYHQMVGGSVVIDAEFDRDDHDPIPHNYI
jgi:hypothetical protein